MPKQPAPPPPAPTEPPPAVAEVPEPPITLDPIPPPVALGESAAAPPSVEKTPLQWAKEKDVKRWQLAGAAAGERWPTDKVLSEVEFDAAIQRALGAQSG